MAEVYDTAVFAKELHQKLEQVEQVDPMHLADLFRSCMHEGPLQEVLRHTLQKFLLKKTIEHARRHTRYYAEISAYQQWIETTYEDPPNLCSWPVITRQLVMEHFDELIADDVHLRSVCHTSGTTGRPLNIYKSFEEVTFLNSYYQQLLRPLIASRTSLPLTLSFPNSYHGVPVPLPSFGMTFVSGVTDDTLIQDALRVLDDTYNIPGYDKKISIVSGLGHHILFFTSYILEQGIDPKSFGIESVNITGGYQAPHWRHFLQDAWGAMVNDRFTLTEIVGGAARCDGCGQFHMEPHIIAEVIDLDSGEPVAEGIGDLVLTNLYPFVQMQPLIRYKTGDLVYRFWCENRNAYGFEFLGKSKNCISWNQNGQREWLVFSARLNDVLAALPDIRIYDWFSNVRVAKDRTIGSLPLLSTKSTEENGQLIITITVELKYAPHCYAERVQELKAHLSSSLKAVPNTTLADRIESGNVILQINFVGPEALNEPIVIKI